MKKYIIVIILMLGISVGATFLPRSFGSKEKMIFQVKKGQGVGEISLNLEKDGLIWWDPLFRVYSLISGKADNLQSGCYRLSPFMNIPKITGTLSSGDIAKEKITIPEGFTSEQISQTLSRTVLASNMLARTVLDSMEEYEGYLFPDTYEIPFCAE